jgi:hypothetical protein
MLHEDMAKKKSEGRGARGIFLKTGEVRTLTAYTPLPLSLYPWHYEDYVIDANANAP